jgi:non-specific serine/threonine protein kinase
LGVAAFQGRVYAVGGRTGGLSGNLDAFEAFNPTTGNWASLPDLPTARGGLAAAATSNGFIVAAGGEEPSGTFEEAEAFDVAAGEWMSLPPLPTPRHGLGVAAVGTVVFVVVGGPDPGLSVSSVNEAIDLAPLGA